MQFDGVAEPCATFDAEIDYDDEQRYAEHEYDRCYGTLVCAMGAASWKDAATWGS